MPVTTLFNPSLNTDIEAFNFLDYQQLPTSPVFAVPSATAGSGYALVADITLGLPPTINDIPVLLSPANQIASGTTLNTDGSVFNGLEQVDITSLTPFTINPFSIAPFAATANTGYAGFTNYTIAGLENISFADLQAGNVDIDALLNSATFTTSNASFPVLDPVAGFTLSFDLAIANEDSNPNRAGFSLTVVTNDPTKEIELGFTDRGGSDRIFAQSANFTEAADTSTSGVTLDFGTLKTYALTVKDNQYVLSVDGVNILAGALIDYNFNPATSDPPLPASPYDLKNFIFFGDNTDQAYAEFTLGAISITTPDAPTTPTSPTTPTLPTTPTAPTSPTSPVRPPTPISAVFSFEQQFLFTDAEYQSTVVDFDVEIGGLRVAPLFDEVYYLKNNPDVAAAIKNGFLTYGFEHFLLFGINEGRSPGAWFDQSYYLAQNPDVAIAVNKGTMTSAIAHFFNFGHREKRNPNPLFQADDYLLNNPDVKAAVEVGAFDSPFEHYSEFGAREGRQQGLLYQLFQESYYLQQNPDVAAAVKSGVFDTGLDHFLIFGQREGRDPSSLFDQSGYLDLYSDVAAAVAANPAASAFEHYVIFGRAEGRLAVAVGG